jgi:peroxidase
MRLLVLTAAALVINAASCINVPSTSYSTYHAPQPTSSHANNPFIKKHYNKPPVSSNYYSSYYTPATAAASPWSKATPVPSQMCPASPPQCIKSRYRTLDGTCNNQQNPLWGSANMRYGRLLTPKYGDGIMSPTTSITGQELPNSRLISLIVFGENDVPDPQFTIANMQWGQVSWNLMNSA